MNVITLGLNQSDYIKRLLLYFQIGPNFLLFDNGTFL